jgi:N-acyl-D-aspartate/D-glutamate deacylase
MVAIHTFSGDEAATVVCSARSDGPPTGIHAVIVGGRVATRHGRIAPSVHGGRLLYRTRR